MLRKIKYVRISFILWKISKKGLEKQLYWEKKTKTKKNLMQW